MQFSMMVIPQLDQKAYDDFDLDIRVSQSDPSVSLAVQAQTQAVDSCSVLNADALLNGSEY